MEHKDEPAGIHAVCEELKKLVIRQVARTFKEVEGEPPLDLPHVFEIVNRHCHGRWPSDDQIQLARQGEDPRQAPLEETLWDAIDDIPNAYIRKTKLTAQEAVVEMLGLNADPIETTPGRQHARQIEKLKSRGLADVAGRSRGRVTHDARYFLAVALVDLDKLAVPERRLVRQPPATAAKPQPILGLPEVDSQPTKQQRTQQPAPFNDGLLTAAQNLADAIRRQLQTEERQRQVVDPFPMPVRWRNGDEALVDHWEQIRGTADPTPLELSDDLDHVVDVFNQVPSGRLVVLGRGGSGKSVLALHLALGLLDAGYWHPGLPVPCVLPLATWNPHEQSFNGWIVEALLERHGWLRSPVGESATLAHALVLARKVLPILDGFDEIAPALRTDALKSINRALDSGDHYLLTSRPDEYAAAVDAGGDVLSAAAVVQLSDLSHADLERYLPLTTRKTVDDSGVATKWDAVLRQLRDAPEEPAAARLLTTLSTPLMVSLARRSYSETDADPAELLDNSRFADRGDLEDHLFSRFIDVAYDQLAVEEALASNGHPAKPRRRWSSDEARRYLGFLAVHLHFTGDRNIQ